MRISDWSSDVCSSDLEFHGEEKDKPAELEWETVNRASALWTRPRTEVKDEEYQEFYKHVGHDFENPLAWSHNKVEGKLEYTSLLFVPGRAPFDLYQREAPKGRSEEHTSDLQSLMRITYAVS